MTLDAYLQTALDAAQAAGGFLRANFGKPLHVDENLAHDIKLELDKRTQALIESIILDRHPDHAIYGEEGLRGDQSAEHQWIIDPIDGTVNFFYNIPHFAVSIALRKAGQILIGVIYDPVRDRLFRAFSGGGVGSLHIPVVLTILRQDVLLLGRNRVNCAAKELEVCHKC